MPSELDADEYKCFRGIRCKQCVFDVSTAKKISELPYEIGFIAVHQMMLNNVTSVRLASWVLTCEGVGAHPYTLDAEETYVEDLVDALRVSLKRHVESCDYRATLECECGIALGLLNGVPREPESTFYFRAMEVMSVIGPPNYLGKQSRITVVQV